MIAYSYFAFSRRYASVFSTMGFTIHIFANSVSTTNLLYGIRTFDKIKRYIIPYYPGIGKFYNLRKSLLLHLKKLTIYIIQGTKIYIK